MFFVASKIFWALVEPVNLVCFLAVFALLLRLIGLRRLGTGLAWTSLLVLLLAAATPVGPYAASALDRRFPLAPAIQTEIGGILVLGGAVSTGRSAAWGQPMFSFDPGRVTNLVMLAHRFPDAPIIYLGGYNGLDTVARAEASYARDMLLAMGFDVDRVIFDDNSKNTFDNAMDAKKLVADTAGKPFVLVTGASHMPRAVSVFRSAGWSVIPWPVDPATNDPNDPWQPLNFSSTLHISTIAMREWIGLIAYRLAGYTDRLLPDAGQ